MKIIYTSTLGCPENDGKTISSKVLDNNNGFVDVLKSCLKNQKTLMFITNRWEAKTPKDKPADEVFNDYHYTNKQYAKAVFDSFVKSGFKFKKLIVMDGDYQGDFKNDLLSSDLVFVQGGHTPRGLKILNELKFKSAAKTYDGAILFTSTSAKLPANKVLSTHHGNMNEYEIENGLGMKNYSVRPHFDIGWKEKLNKKFRNRVRLIKMLSAEIPVVAIGKNSFVVDDGNSTKVFGKATLFVNGKAKPLCKENKCIELEIKNSENH